MQVCQVVIKSASEFFSLCSSNDPEDERKSVMDAASLDTWVKIVKKHPDKCADVAQNRTIPDEVMRLLAVHGNSMTRSILAEIRRLPIDLFYLLSKDSDEAVRKKIASNQKTPLDVLEQLCSDQLDSVAAVAKYNFLKRSKGE